MCALNVQSTEYTHAYIHTYIYIYVIYIYIYIDTRHTNTSQVCKMSRAIELFDANNCS